MAGTRRPARAPRAGGPHNELKARCAPPQGGLGGEARRAAEARFFSTRMDQYTQIVGPVTRFFYPVAGVGPAG